MTASTVVGVVIAGGRSVRFGAEKAVATFRGKSLLALAIQRLQAVCTDVAVNARAQTQTDALARALGHVVLHDAAGDPDGPLAGVKSGLKWALARGASSIVVSPCDAPLLPPDLFARLIAAARGGAASAETQEGPQPLCAVWPVSALPLVEAALAAGGHPPTWRVLAQAHAVPVRFESAQCFVNVNTPAELARIEALHQR